MNEYLKKNIGTIGAGVGGVALGGVVGYVAGRRSSKRKGRKRRTNSKSRRKRSHTHTRRRKVHHFTSRKRIHYTKNGQPYIIKGNGKARFISKKSARMSRKRKGGKY